MRYFGTLASDADYLAKYLDLNNHYTGLPTYYAAGYMFYRYLAKQISDSYDKSFAYPWKDGTSIVSTTGSELLTGSGKGVSIFGGAGNDSVHNFGGQSVKISASDGNNYIYNDSTTKYNSTTQEYETIMPDNVRTGVHKRLSKV